VELDEGDLNAAREYITLSLRSYQTLHNPYGIANCLHRFVWLEIVEERFERAARILGAAETVREAVGGWMSVHDRNRQAEAEATLEAALGAERLAEATAAGFAMSTDEAVAYALDEPA
jgi:hypothetical protein